jgi:hypothetical protein
MQNNPSVKSSEKALPDRGNLARFRRANTASPIVFAELLDAKRRPLYRAFDPAFISYVLQDERCFTLSTSESAALEQTGFKPVWIRH